MDNLPNSPNASQPNRPLPKQHKRTRIRQDMLSNNDIHGPPSFLPLLKLELIIHNDSAHNRLDRIRRKEPTWTCLAPESEVHVRRADTDKTGRCRRNQRRIVWFLVAIFPVDQGGKSGARRVQGMSIIGILTPSEPIESIWICDEGGVFAHWAGGEADVCSFGEEEAI